VSLLELGFLQLAPNGYDTPLTQKVTVQIGYCCKEKRIGSNPRGEQLQSRWKIGRLGDAIEGTGTGHDAGASRSDAMMVDRPFKAGNIIRRLRRASRSDAVSS
jgi:hypothetical protein